MVQVSGVEQVRGHRVRITLEDGSRYTLLRSAYQERPLQEGDEVDPEEYAQWVLEHQYASALERAVAMLAVRACSRGEITQKLERMGYSADTVSMVLYKLEKNQLLDDQDFSNQWAQYRAGKNYGPHRISQELRRKRVSAEEAEKALATLPEEQQLESAVELAEKSLRRSRADEDPRKTRQRMLSAIVRRGYDWEIARQAVDQVLGEEE